MGAGKKRKERFFRQHPYCCFCGGIRLAETEDHVPSRVFFIKRSRPDDFVFPACKSCNSISSKSEQVTALLSRTSYQSEQIVDAPDFCKLVQAVHNNSKGTFQEMVGPRTGDKIIKRQIRAALGSDDFHLLTFGSNARMHCQLFGAKLAFAFHYKFLGRPLPTDGGAIVSIHNQVDFALNRAPHLEIAFNDIESLRQGKWNSEGQFEYRMSLATDFEGGLFQAFFHKNLLFTLITSADGSKLLNEDVPVHVPGELKPVAEAIDPYRITATISGRFAK